MNKIIAGLFATAVAVSFAQADTAAPAPAGKDLTKMVEEGPYVETKKKGITLSGYVDAGYTYNFRGGVTGGAAASGGVTRPATDNQARGDFDLNAIKIALEKPLSDANELQAGFRMDIMMGEDVASIGGQNGAGNNSDDLYLQQAFVQFRAPVGNGLDFKVGKFVTPLGFEVQERPANMNITYGALWNFQPLWHTGVMASYKYNDYVDNSLAIVNGWKDDNAIGGANVAAADSDDSAALIYTLGLNSEAKNARLQNGVIISFDGEDGSAGTPNTDNSAANVLYDVWGWWKPKFANDKLTFGFNIDLGTFETATGAASPAGDQTTWWGAAVYTSYKFTDIFTLSSRAEYLHNDDDGRTGVNQAPGVANPTDVDLWSWTLTGSFDVIENMMLRTEYRMDWGADYTRAAGETNTSSLDGPAHQATLQVVYSF